MLAGYSFRPRRWPLALAAAACAAGIALGSWQTRRAEEKRALGAEVDQALKAAPIEISTTPVENKNLILKRVAARGAFAADTGLALQPIVIEQRSDSGDGLLREWPRPDAGIERHQSYALQWYSLAALAVILAAVLSFRRIG